MRGSGCDFMRHMRGIAIEPTYFDMEHEEVDVPEIVALAKRVHANTLRVGFFSHQGYAYYQSDIVPAAPGLGGRDLLEEFDKECRNAGLSLVVYTNTSVTSPHLQPEGWCVNLSGEPYIRGGFPLAFMCHNSPYHEYYKSVATEIVSRYNPEAMYLDCFGLALFCRCACCREQFIACSGQDVPHEADWSNPIWHEYLKWLDETNRRHARSIVEAMKRIRPDLNVLFNRPPFWNSVSSPPEETAVFAHGIGDNIHIESAVRFYDQPFRHIDEQCMFGQAIGGPVWVWVEYPVMPWSHLSCPTAETKIKAAKVMANGGRPMVWSVPRSPDCDERGLDGIKTIYELVERNERFFGDSDPLKFAGILCSTQTLRLNCRTKDVKAPGEAELTPAAHKYKLSFQGTEEMLRKSHVPFGIILDGQVTDVGLSEYKVLILPSSSCLSDHQCDAIRKFVRGGGGLIASYEASLCDENGKQRENFGLRDVFGCNFVGYGGSQNAQSEQSTELIDLAQRRAGYMETEGEHPVLKGFPVGFKLPVDDGYLEVSAVDGRTLAAMLVPSRYYCDYHGRNTRHPGLLVNDYGEGRVVYIPHDIGSTYSEHGFAEYKSMVGNAVGWAAAGELPVITDLPDTVDVTMAKGNDGTIIIHLVNCTADLSCPVDRVVPVSHGTLHVKLSHGSKPGKVHSLLNDAQLDCRVEGDKLVVDIPDIQEYEVIVIGS